VTFRRCREGTGRRVGGRGGRASLVSHAPPRARRRSCRRASTAAAPLRCCGAPPPGRRRRNMSFVRRTATAAWSAEAARGWVRGAVEVSLRAPGVGAGRPQPSCSRAPQPPVRGAGAGLIGRRARVRLAHRVGVNASGDWPGEAGTSGPGAGADGSATAGVRISRPEGRPIETLKVIPFSYGRLCRPSGRWGPGGGARGHAVAAGEPLEARTCPTPDTTPPPPAPTRSGP
jgi:hypothetical protein